MLRIKDRSELRKYSPTRLHNAFKAVKDNGIPVYRAACQFDVPLTTLRDRVDGRISIDTVKSGPDPLLNLEEETRLVNHLNAMAELGYGYSRSETIQLASEYAVQVKRRTPDKPLSRQWYSNFTNRWPDIKLKSARGLDIFRAKSSTPEKVHAYFAALNDTLTKYNLKDKPECIYNIDEKGLSLNHKPPKVVCSKSIKPVEVTSGKMPIVTVIGAGNALGSKLPPFFVFPGQRMREELLTGGLPGTNGSVSETGWSNSSIFMTYMTEHFIKFVQGRSDDQPVLVLYDGHSSHVSLQLIDWARSNNIIIHLLPAHTSHFLQPLDVGCFKPLEDAFNYDCHLFMKRNIGQLITRNEVCELSSKPYQSSLSSENLISSFRKCGIYPFNPSVVDLSCLKPSSVFKENLPTAEDVESDPISQLRDACDELSAQHSENDRVDDECNIQNFLQVRLPVVNVLKQKKPRKVLSKITSGKAVTEETVYKQICEFKEQTKKPKKQPRSKSSDNEKVPRKKSKKSKSPLHAIPSTSGAVSRNAGPLPVDSDSSLSDSEDANNFSDKDLCCVCRKYYPEALRECISLTIVNWACCDKCGHWTHLRFCSPINVVRRHSEFVCPHCA